MEKTAIIGIDPAKRTFEMRDATADGSVTFRRKLSRARLLKPFVKRQKNDAADAEATAEAAVHPTMRFVAVKPGAAGHCCSGPAISSCVSGPS